MKTCDYCTHVEMCGWRKEVEEQGCEFISDGPCWIPVSERLPEIGQKVLASTQRTMFTQVFKGVYSEPNVWHWEHNTIKVITAWMPLPEPYKGGEDE